MSDAGHPGFSVRLEELRGRVVISAAGEVDLANRPAVDHLIGEVLATVTGPLLLQLDLREVTFINSAGIELLLITRNLLTRGDAQFMLRPSPSVDDCSDSSVCALRSRSDAAPDRPQASCGARTAGVELLRSSLVRMVVRLDEPFELADPQHLVQPWTCAVEVQVARPAGRLFDLEHHAKRARIDERG